MRTVFAVFVVLLFWAVFARAGTTVKRGPFNAASVPTASPVFVGSVPVTSVTDPIQRGVRAPEVLGGTLATVCTGPLLCGYLLPTLPTGRFLTVVSTSDGQPIRLKPQALEWIRPLTTNGGNCILSSGNEGDLITLLSVGGGVITILDLQGGWTDAGNC